MAPGLFYGWLVAVGAGLVSFACVGIGFYSVAVLLDALPAQRGWSKATVSGASTLYFLVSAAAGSLVGRALDRGDGRRWIAAGACLLAAGLVLVGRASAPWQLWVVYPLMAVGYAMCSNLPTNALITRWFVELRSRALTITQTGVSLGGVLIVPLATALVERHGLETATQALAALVLAIALPVTLLVLRWDPDAHGLEPDGGRFLRAGSPRLSDAVQRRVWSAGEALRTAAFWQLAVAFGAILFSQMGVLVHEVALVRERIDAPTAALAVSTTAAGSLLGRLALGSFADRLHKVRVGQALFVLQGAALIALSFASTRPSVYAAAFAFGLTVGNIFMLQGLLTAELFGIPSFGTVFGMLQLPTQLAGGLGPVAIGLLYGASGGYGWTLRLLAGTALAAAAVLGSLRPPPAPRAVPR